MLASVQSYAIVGVDALSVRVEVDAFPGLPGFDTVGLPDAAVREARDRVRSAVRNSGFEVPALKVVANLAPADLKKVGPWFDLPLAVGLLAATGQAPKEVLADAPMVGELSLDGSIRPLHGALPIIIAARERGIKRVLLPAANALEGGCVEGVELLPAQTLKQVVGWLKGDIRIEPQPHLPFSALAQSGKPRGGDFADVRGQRFAKRALEIAAAGGHNALLIGPPGSGKTLLAGCVPGILPPMTFEESLEVSRVYSVCGEIPEGAGLVVDRPFRAPHHTASAVALIGGGSNAIPGEITKAHNGVLFLDELAEYPRQVLDVLRQPLEDGVVTVVRVGAQMTYPSRFMLVCAMNPCPCGHLGDRKKQCTCSQTAIERYRARVSKPLLDRIDIRVEVECIPARELLDDSEREESSAEVRERVMEARLRQQKRYKGLPTYANAHLTSAAIKRFCPLDGDSRFILEQASERFHLSNRGQARVIKLARTVADLEGKERIAVKHIAEAVKFRGNDSL